MRNLTLITMIAACGPRRPLAPGETRCFGQNLGGVIITRCNTGQAAPTPSAVPAHRPIKPEPTFYCVDFIEGGLSCHRSLAECETKAGEVNANNRPGRDTPYAECITADVAYCVRARFEGDVTDEYCWATVERCDGFLDYIDKSRVPVVSGCKRLRR